MGQGGGEGQREEERKGREGGEGRGGKEEKQVCWVTLLRRERPLSTERMAREMATMV